MPRAPYVDGVLRAVALAPGFVPLGLIMGAVSVESGPSPAAAVALSALVFAGGAQFAAATLFATGTNALTVVGLVFLINARYFLMSAATLDLARRSGAGTPSRVALALGTVDESFAIQAAWAKSGVVPTAGLLAVPLTLWSIWVATTAVGAFVGSNLPDLDPLGLDYVLPGLFIGLFGIFADSRPKLAAGVAALAVQAALVLLGLGAYGLLIVPPTFAFAVGAFVHRAREADAA